MVVCGLDLFYSLKKFGKKFKWLITGHTVYIWWYPGWHHQLDGHEFE